MIFSHGCDVMASGFARGHVHMTMTKATESCEEDGGRTDRRRRRRRAYSSWQADRIHKSADVVRRQLGDLGKKIAIEIQVIFRSRKCISQNHQLWTSNAFFIAINMTCVMEFMSAIRADAFINTLKGIKDQPLVKICSRSMEANNLALKHLSILRKRQRKLDCLMRFFLL